MSEVVVLEIDADDVKKFRRILYERDLLPSSQDNYGTLVRFLRATRCDLDKATHMWAKMIKWRRDNKVDTIIQDFVFEEYEDVLRCHPHGYHGVDKKGRPIYIDMLGKTDFIKLMKVTSADRFLRSYVQGYEKAFAEKFPACSRDANKPIDSMTRIVDFHGMNYKGSKEFFQKKIAPMRKIGADYYPENTHRFIGVNVGVGTRLMWELTKRIRYRNIPLRIHYFGSNFQKKLLEFVDESQLPDFLGGSCSCSEEGGCLGSEKGPWKVQETMQDANVEMDPNMGQVLPEMMHNVELAPSPYMGQTLPGAMHNCYTELDDKLNVLSDKLDKIQTTLNQMVAKQQDTSDLLC